MFVYWVRCSKRALELIFLPPARTTKTPFPAADASCYIVDLPHGSTYTHGEILQVLYLQFRYRGKRCYYLVKHAEKLYVREREREREIEQWQGYYVEERWIDGWINRYRRLHRTLSYTPYLSWVIYRVYRPIIGIRKGVDCLFRRNCIGEDPVGKYLHFPFSRMCTRHFWGFLTCFFSRRFFIIMIIIELSCPSMFIFKTQTF